MVRSVSCGRAAVIAGVTLLSAARLKAQAVVHPSRPACTSCRITVHRIARLGDEEGDGAFPNFPTSIAQDSKGNFLVAMHQPPDEALWFFDRAGHFVRRIGRSGSGPGEYRGARVVVISGGDTIHVFDGTLARQTVLGPDLKVLGTTAIPRRTAAAIQLRGGKFILNANVTDADRIGLTYHEFRHNGAYVGSFGKSGQRVSPFQPVATIRWMAPASDGGFWAVPWAYRYSVEHWNKDFELDRVIEPQFSWYEPYDSLQTPTPTRPPQPTLFGVWEDPSEHLLWVLAQAADSRWKDALGAPRVLEGSRVFPIEDRQGAYDSILSVFDSRTGALIANARLPLTLELVVRPGVVAGIREDAAGRIFADVWAVGLQR